MDLHISKNSEQFVRSQVKKGRYASEQEVIEDALRLLEQREGASTVKTPMTEEELERHFLAIGLMTELPDTENDYEDPDEELIEIEGEPLSETIIRERR